MNSVRVERLDTRKWPVKLFVVLVVAALAAASILVQLGGTLAASADKAVTLQCDSGVSPDFHLEKGESKTMWISYLSDARSTDTGIATVSFTAGIDGEAIITGVKAGVTNLIFGNVVGNVGSFKFQVTDSENISAYTLKDGGEINFDGKGVTKPSPVVDVTGQAGRIAWRSMNENVATVAANGAITSVGPGMTIITGDFIDKWGAPRYINILASVGGNVGPGFTVTSVTVTPGDGVSLLWNDEYILFIATVNGRGDVPQDVTWQIQHSLHSSVTISSHGMLYVPISLSLTTPESRNLIIRAVSVADPGVYKDVRVDLGLWYSEPDFSIGVVGQSPPFNSNNIKATSGSSLQFYAESSIGMGIEPGTLPDITNDVVWEVVENESAATTISPSGLLTIAADETALYVVVRATSFLRINEVSRYLRVNIV